MNPPDQYFFKAQFVFSTISWGKYPAFYLLSAAVCSPAALQYPFFTELLQSRRLISNQLFVFQ